MSLSTEFLGYFEVLGERRKENHSNFRHKLSDILAVTILGCICGTNILFHRAI